MKKILYTLLGFFITSTSYAACEGGMDTFGTCRITENMKHTNTDLITISDNMLWYFIWLFYFIAIVIWVYWWFQILISWWDEEKVKKGKNYLVYMVIWLIVIFLASIIVNWIIDVMTTKVVS